MTDMNQAAAQGSTEEFHAEWAAFTPLLAEQLGVMLVPPSEDDLLVLEVGGAGEGEAFPKARFTVAAGTTLIADICGAVHVSEDPEEIARLTVATFAGELGIPHPQLITYRAWGPAADDAEDLGLSETEIEGGAPAPTVLTPTSREELSAAIGALLQSKYEPVTLDDDGDWVITHLGQPVFVRAVPQEPAVLIFARVAHGVYSRRGAAAELAVINRDSPWVHWALHGRDIWQKAPIQANPFAAQHLEHTLNVFLNAMTATRDDLALRTRGQAA